MLSFYHPLTMHGSYENVSDRSRRAIVLNAMSSDTLGNTAGYERLDALKDFPAMDQDKVLDSNFFPLLFDGDKELAALGNVIPMASQAALYDKRV